MPYVPTGLRPASSAFTGFEGFRDYLRTGTEPQGGFPQISGSGGELGGGLDASGLGGGEEPAPEIDQGIQRPAPLGGEQGRYFDFGGSSMEGLFSPVRRQLGEATAGIGRLGEEFRTAAGQDRTWDSLGARSTLERAISPHDIPDRREEAQGLARGLLGAEYGGPAGLNPEAAQGLRGQVQQAQQQAAALGTGGGLQSILGAGIPGLSPGEAAFEAQHVLGQPGFREGARDLGFQAAAPLGLLGNEEAAATARAGERTAQEEAIASQSRDFLTGRRSEITDQLQADVAAKAAEQKRMEDIYTQIQASGDVAALPDELEAQFVNTPGQELTREAQAARDEVLGRYGDLKQFDPLEKKKTKRGKEWYGWADKETGKVTDIRHLKTIPGTDIPMTKDIERRFVQRQRELEALSGSDLGRKKDKEQTPYRDVTPLYFDESVGGDYAAPDFRPYTSFDPGVTPTRENLATDDQQHMFNEINSLLDEVDRISDAGEPYRAATMAADIKKWLDDEEFAFKGRGKELNAQEKAYRKQLRKMRSNYKSRSVRHGGWGDLVSVLSGAGSGGGTTILGMDEGVRGIVD